MSHRWGVVPVSSRKRRANVRDAQPACRARSATCRGWSSRSSAQAQVAASPTLLGGAGRCRNWAWPPVRWCDHHAPRDLGRDLLAVVAANQVHAQVDPGGDADAGHHRLIGDVEHIGVKAHRRVAGAQLGGVSPRRGRPSPVQQSCCGQRERAGANRHDPRAGGGGIPQLLRYPWSWLVVGGVAGHHDRVGGQECVQAPQHRHRKPGGGGHKPGIGVQVSKR